MIVFLYGKRFINFFNYSFRPADAALMMQLGCDGVFVGSGIFKSGNPAKRARAIVQAVTHYDNPEILAEVSEDLGDAMVCCLLLLHYHYLLKTA